MLPIRIDCTYDLLSLRKIFMPEPLTWDDDHDHVSPKKLCRKSAVSQTEMKRKDRQRTGGF